MVVELSDLMLDDQSTARSFENIKKKHISRACMYLNQLTAHK